jgi:hypothetical protein
MGLSFGSTQTIQGGVGNPGGSFITSTTSMVSGNAAMAQYYQKYGSFFSNADIQGITWDRSGFWDVQKTTIEALIVQPGLTAQVQKLIQQQAEPVDVYQEAMRMFRLIPPEILRILPRFPGNDATKPPGSGFEWRGAPGAGPETGKGNWYNPTTQERWHPDLNHPDPKGPHWTYWGSDGKGYDYFPDGRIVPLDFY